MPSEKALAQAKSVISEAKRITVLTGAGISTDSGIPDYRGPNGVWTKDPEAEKLSSIEYYLADSKIRRASWRAWKEFFKEDKRPNLGHDKISELYLQGKLNKIITQNIDKLHGLSLIHAIFDRASSAQIIDAISNVIELHGNDYDAQCSGDCRLSYPARWVYMQLEDGIEDIICPNCKTAPLKRGVVYFGEDLDAKKWETAEEAIARSDVLLIVGTSLQVYPVAFLPFPAYDNPDCTVIIVNGSSTGGDDYANIVLEGDISSILDTII